jgi:transposase
MSRGVSRTFSREFKLTAVHRMLSGENVTGLARELRVLRKDLYKWRDNFRAHGPESLRGPGRPPKSVRVAAGAAGPRASTDELTRARRQIAELERKIGQQQVDLDFFRRALRQVRGTRRPSDGSGAMASTPSCRR